MAKLEEIKRLEREARQLRFKAGLCLHCSAKVMPGHRKCEAHVIRQRGYQQKSYLNKKAAGICIACDKPAVKGKVHCKVHLIYYKNKTAELRKRRKKDATA